MIKHFSDFTNTPWDTVWDKPIIEILNVLAFAKEYNNQQKKLMDRYKRK